MKEIKSDIWVKYSTDANCLIVIPTNGTVKKSGEAVMGRGLALGALMKFPTLPKLLGERIRQIGNIVNVFHNYRLITFPVKHNWWEKADLSLINESAQYLSWILDETKFTVYIPHVGCGNGGLDWADVQPILERHLGKYENVIVVDLL